MGPADRLSPAGLTAGVVLLAVLALATWWMTQAGRPGDGGEEAANSTTAMTAGAPAASSTTTTTAPTTTTTSTTVALAAPDRLHLRFDQVEPFGFDSPDAAARLRAATGVDLRHFHGASELSVVDDPSGVRALRQRYVPGRSGSPVVEFVGRFPPGEEMWLSYRVLFEPGWEWVRGGKLPGLGGGSRPTGGEAGDGEDGFSARLMWRDGPRLVVYAYHPDRPRSFGQDLRLSGEVPVGRWFTVTQHIVINSAPDRRDGVVEAWIDGELRLSMSDLRWRTTGDFGVDQLDYSSFYGGDDRSWAPSGTTFARFAEFRVSSDPAGVERSAPLVG